MVRTQLYLDDGVHARLRSLAKKQGRTLSELVREALLKTYGDDDIEEDIAAIRGIEGLWRDRKDVGSTRGYVRRLRRGTGRRRRRLHS